MTLPRLAGSLLLATIATIVASAQQGAQQHPQAARIAQGFATQSFTTTDSRQLTGSVVREGQDEVIIRDLAGAGTTLRKAAVVSRSVSEGSMMPAGLVDTLSVEELASLLAFLESTVRVP